MDKSDNKDSSVINVLFGCTSLAKDSTLIENYDFIQYKLNDVFDNWNALEKNSHFVFKGIKYDTSEDRYGLEMIQKDNYIFKEPIHNKFIVDFIVSSELKFDMILLGECSNLIDLFVDSKTMRSLFDEDIKTLFKKVKDFYHGVKNNGILINLYYNETDGTTAFANLETFYSYSSLWSLDVYLFLLRIMNQIFKRIEPGIYQKEQIDDLDGIIDKTYHTVIEELFHIGVDNLDNKDVLIGLVDKTYFNGTLLKVNTFSVERPIMNNMSNLVEETLKTME
jgi:hypothetical protein